jgi:putative membrane protein
MENQNLQSPRRSLLDYLTITIRGFLMGTADAVPGVSGGTVALLVGIYEELIQSIRAVADLRHLQRVFRLQFKALLDELPWKFLLALVLGIFAGAVTLAHLLENLLETQPLFVWAFFFGLVAASAVVVARRVRVWGGANVLLLIGGAVITYLVVGLVPMDTPDTFLAFFLSGMIAICAMILPGISGAFVLVLLGKYQDVLAAVTGLDIPRLIVFLLGAVVGISLFSRVLGWLFRRFHDATITLMIGLMLGSLRKLWPWKGESAGVGEILTPGGGESLINVLPAWSGETLLVAVVALFGFGLVVGLEGLAARRKMMTSTISVPAAGE